MGYPFPPKILNFRQLFTYLPHTDSASGFGTWLANSFSGIMTRNLYFRLGEALFFQYP